MGRYTSDTGGGANGQSPVVIAARKVVHSAASSIALYGESIMSGALVQNVWKELLAINSPGVLKFCAVHSMTANAQTFGFRIVIDGVVSFDYEFATTTNTQGVVAVGALATGSSPTIALDRMPFNTLSVQVRSTVAATDALRNVTIYDLVQG